MEATMAIFTPFERAFHLLATPWGSFTSLMAAEVPLEKISNVTARTRRGTYLMTLIFCQSPEESISAQEYSLTLPVV